MDFYESHWECNGDLYSLYVPSDGIPHYLKSRYNKKDDIWNVYTNRVPNSVIQVYHPPYLFDIKSTNKSDYKFILSYDTSIKDTIEKLCNKIGKPSIDDDPNHVYPSGDLVKKIREMTIEQYSNWMRYISNGD